jgi:hypothetical protein
MQLRLIRTDEAPYAREKIPCFGKAAASARSGSTSGHRMTHGASMLAFKCSTLAIARGGMEQIPHAINRPT